MCLRKKLKDYPHAKNSLARLKQERESCLDLDKIFSLDAAISDAEREIDQLLTDVMNISDELSRAFIIDHFIEGRSIYQLEIKFCYSKEWIYKKIAIGIDEINNKRRPHDEN